MKSKKRIVIQYFLRCLQDKMQWDDNVDAINAKWLKIYNKQELKSIVKWLFMQNVPQEMDLDTMDEEELLGTIGDEYHMLGYLLHEMDQELIAFENPTQQSVWELLEQLAHQTHYLASKPINEWDAYDLSNYQSLARKAGNPIPLYGVFDANVTQEDKYLVTLPGTLYQSEEEALQLLSNLVKKEQFNETEMKVMML